jgi:hypothetical protein
MHPAHVGPRSRTPTLLINGKDDFLFSYEFAQQPFFALLGAPDAQKRHARLEGGHIPTHRLEIARNMTGWINTSGQSSEERW